MYSVFFLFSINPLFAAQVYFAVLKLFATLVPIPVSNPYSTFYLPGADSLQYWLL